MTEAIPFVSFTPRSANKVYIMWQFITFQKTTNSGKLSCYIPGFDIYYSANNIEQAEKKSQALMKMFIDHFVLHAGKKSTLKHLVIHLHKLGFKAPSDTSTIYNIIHGKLKEETRFKSKDEKIPSEFLGSDRVVREAELEIAV